MLFAHVANLTHHPQMIRGQLKLSKRSVGLVMIIRVRVWESLRDATAGLYTQMRATDRPHRGIRQGFCAYPATAVTLTVAVFIFGKEASTSSRASIHHSPDKGISKENQVRPRSFLYMLVFCSMDCLQEAHRKQFLVTNGEYYGSASFDNVTIQGFGRRRSNKAWIVLLTTCGLFVAGNYCVINCFSCRLSTAGEHAFCA